jgi:hypothetical protein
MFILLRSPPPRHLTQLTITAIACPSIGDDVKIALKITIGGNKSPKKKPRRRLILCAGGSSTPLGRWFDGGGAKRGWFAGGGVLQDGSFTPGEGGEVDSSDQQKFWRIMSSCHLFASCAHSSSAGAKPKKELLCQSLYLGLPGVNTDEAALSWSQYCMGENVQG